MARIDVLGGFGLAVQGSKFHFTLTIVSLTLAKCKTGKKNKTETMRRQNVSGLRL